MNGDGSVRMKHPPLSTCTGLVMADATHLKWMGVAMAMVRAQVDLVEVS